MDPEFPKKQNIQFRKSTKSSANYYVPGKTEGQPFKENPFRFCYNITKRLGNTTNRFGDVRLNGA